MAEKNPKSSVERSPSTFILEKLACIGKSGTNNWSEHLLHA